ncbi:MAG: cytochrome b [Thiomargarita sp.]|nr:cytochrome b [Thiomargarita sp.]
MITKYHPSIRILHWIMFVLFAAIFIVGVVMVEFKMTEPWTMYHFHKSTGVLVLLLVFIRLTARIMSEKPAPSDQISTIQQIVAKIVVYILYLLMIIVPISGYALSNVHGYSVDLYGLALPTIFSANPAWEETTDMLHHYLVYTFLAVFTLHLLAVIKHQVKGIEVLHRIT